MRPTDEQINTAISRATGLTGNFVADKNAMREALLRLNKTQHKNYRIKLREIIDASVKDHKTRQAIYYMAHPAVEAEAFCRIHHSTKRPWKTVPIQ